MRKGKVPESWLHDHSVMGCDVHHPRLVPVQHRGQLRAPSPSRGTAAAGQEGEWGPAMGQGMVGAQGIRGSEGLGSAGRAEPVIEV